MQGFTFGSIASLSNRDEEEEQFDNINRKEALDIVSAPNSNNSVAILQEYLPNASLDPNVSISFRYYYYFITLFV